jgi:hypothetical protein
MSKASLELHPIPGLEKVTRIVIDCEHAITGGFYIPGHPACTIDDAVRILLAKHRLDCDCGSELEREYGTDLRLTAPFTRDIRPPTTNLGPYFHLPAW